MKRIKKIFSKKYHWYRVLYTYETELVKSSFYVNVALTRQSKVLDTRSLKKIIPPLHIFLKEEHRCILSNGKFEANVQCYLGRFKSLNLKSIVKASQLQ